MKDMAMVVFHFVVGVVMTFLGAGFGGLVALFVYTEDDGGSSLWPLGFFPGVIALLALVAAYVSFRRAIRIARGKS